MITYISAFIFYTLAMVGVLLIGFVVYKKMMINPSIGNKGLIKILDNYPIAPKKTLIVVKIKDEKFLIASGVEHTTFLAKLEDNKNSFTENNDIDKSRIELALSQMQNTKTHKSEIMINDITPKETRQKDELQQVRLQKLQKKFTELYNEDNDSKEINQENQSQNRRVLNRILQELNSTEKRLGSKTNNG